MNVTAHVLDVARCTVDRCTTVDKAPPRKGLCSTHYMRVRRWGHVGLNGPQPKACTRCGSMFQPETNRVEYCSEACKRGVKICRTCSKEFLPTPGSAGFYCSRSCWSNAPRPGKPCPVCSTEFVSPAKTCSRRCGRELRRRTHPQRSSGCESCGGSMIEKKPTARFCSLSCANRGREPGRGGALPDGSRYLRSDGYVDLKVDGIWVREHRHVVQLQLGRRLERHERVHHKNGQRADNRSQNLELWKVRTKDPAGVRASDYHCSGCRCGELAA